MQLTPIYIDTQGGGPQKNHQNTKKIGDYKLGQNYQNQLQGY